jgi:hypothetical protein
VDLLGLKTPQHTKFKYATINNILDGNYRKNVERNEPLMRLMCELLSPPRGFLLPRLLDIRFKNGC